MAKTKKTVIQEMFPCKSCSFYAFFEGVCCNGDCDYRADNPPYSLKYCLHWNEKSWDADQK